MRPKRRLRDEGGLLLTPLIDMVFLIVIFFMLNTTLSMNPAIKVDLPAAYTSQSLLKEEIVVTMSGNRDIYIGKVLIPPDRFPAELKEEMVRIKTNKMILQADELLPYRDIIEIMDMARLTGIESISLVTVKKSLPE